MFLNFYIFKIHFTNHYVMEPPSLARGGTKQIAFSQSWEPTIIMGSKWTGCDNTQCFGLLQNHTVATQDLLSIYCHHIIMICKGWVCQPVASSNMMHLWGLWVTLFYLGAVPACCKTLCLGGPGFLFLVSSRRVVRRRGSQMAVRLSALRAGRPGRFLVLNSVGG
jgi:hypothetical protein